MPQSNEVAAFNRIFQLEEMEDADRFLTALCLEPDGSIVFGQSDGPTTSAISGWWEQSDTGDFCMTIKRTFTAGHAKRHATDVGEFSFDVERQYVGTMEYVGANLAIEGSIVMVDELLGDEEVGFFSMIDTQEDHAVAGGWGKVVQLMQDS